MHPVELPLSNGLRNFFMGGHPHWINELQVISVGLMHAICGVLDTWVNTFEAATGIQHISHVGASGMRAIVPYEIIT